MDEPERRRVASGLVELVEHPSDLLAELVRRRVREDAVGEAGGAADGGLGAAADEDRDPGRGRRTDGQRRQPVDLSLVGERLAAPRLRQDPEDLLHRRAATAHVGAQPGVLDLRPAQPQPEHEPAVAQQLDGRRVLGEAQRVVHRGEDDAGPDLDP